MRKQVSEIGEQEIKKSETDMTEKSFCLDGSKLFNGEILFDSKRKEPPKEKESS